jgi:uncharacterized protein YjbJ (UPF0337 family)
MSGTEDRIKGKAKEAVGDLTNDDEMRRGGKVDQAAGKAKEKIDDAKDWMEDKIGDHDDDRS